MRRRKYDSAFHFPLSFHHSTVDIDFAFSASIRLAPPSIFASGISTPPARLPHFYRPQTYSPLSFKIYSSGTVPSEKKETPFEFLYAQKSHTMKVHSKRWTKCPSTIFLFLAVSTSFNLFIERDDCYEFRGNNLIIQYDNDKSANAWNRKSKGK